MRYCEIGGRVKCFASRDQGEGFVAAIADRGLYAWDAPHSGALQGEVVGFDVDVASAL